MLLYKRGPELEQLAGAVFENAEDRVAVVTDDGITLKGPAGSIVIGATETTAYGNTAFWGTETHRGDA